MRKIVVVGAILSLALGLSGCTASEEFVTGESMKQKLVEVGVGCGNAEINSYDGYSLLVCENANGESFQVTISQTSLMEIDPFTEICVPGYEPGAASKDPIVAGSNWYIQDTMNSFTPEDLAEKLGGQATTYIEACRG